MSTEPQRPEKRRRGSGFFVVIVLAVLVLYVGSTGPVLRYQLLSGGGNAFATTMESVHGPLFEAAQASPVIGKPLMSYLNLWLPGNHRAEWNGHGGLAVHVKAP